MKKNDVKLIAIIIAAAVICALFFLGKKEDKNQFVKIEVDGTEFGCYSMKEDQVIEINGTNRLEIKGQKAAMSWADCPDQICVHHIAIAHKGETIVCLPNKVVISVTDGDDNEFDAITD